MTVRGRSVGEALTTSAVDVYVVPSNFVADVETIHICNKTNSNKEVTLQWYESSTTHTHSLLNTTTIAAYSYIQLDKPLILNAGDKIIAFASVGASVDVTVRLQESYTPIKMS